ncbi:phosphomethylpyrimidine kinase [Candidatus Endolissoclinum faulkneri L2]|uniref:hydroxymethylpyrimidine kinase n=1 Tax=Candidatus Endolissoclinum faulkneri L2 TaxID=1193729 RepID=K7YQ58_9PROT|nr:bifunctional hydroxymethylpyrimidine kinase/phosphomethylpyrimidine kinase [Candidatus Endolissoclinum faulkneri]AFX98714.1 phosphomethylpyrimidine kinase [Candidatus Endolissoclinum faulkneri L2]
MSRLTKGRVLIAAGSDPSGGAGIQADIKVVTALGGYAMTAITALTAQNTKCVFDIHSVPITFLRKQLELILDDIGTDVIKTGMLHSGLVIDVIVDVIQNKARDIPLIVDPVMIAKGGGCPLLDLDAMQVLKDRLIMRAHLLTPNLPEAEYLTGLAINNLDDMYHAAELLLSLGPSAVLLKGGHLLSETVIDLMVTKDNLHEFRSPRINSNNTHGTGCTLASAIATGLAQGLSMKDAVSRARKYVFTAIATAPRYKTAGYGPLNHVHTVIENI